jgi:hypothetical protein
MVVNSRITKKITAVYHVLKSNMNVKQGLYQVKHGKEMALASGLYNNNKRVGIWHFFDYKSNLMQNFDYDHNIITYEAVDDDLSRFKYLFDVKVAATDTVTKPMKIGGRYFGYLPLINFFKQPDWLEMYYGSYPTLTLEILVSPAGNLADFTIHINDYDKNSLNVNINLLALEDKVFVPATINRQPVSSRIIIPCTIDNSGNIVL